MEGKLILFFFAVLSKVQSEDATSSKPTFSIILNKNERKEYKEIESNNPESNKDTINSGRRDSGTKLYERPLSVGDTFTPTELLPVTQKLIEKVENPGVGKGIVSGAKNPKDLADKLFEAFFVTTQRIVKLNEHDIKGLDALQALALSGQVTLLRQLEYVAPTEAPDEVTLSFRGQTISVNAQPIKSKYQLLTKKDNKIIRKVFVRRGGIKLAQKLWKNRHLIMNPGQKRRNHNSYRFGKNPELNRRPRLKPKTRGNKRQRQAPPSDKKYCHWRYHCTSPTDLDTCQLKTDCNKDTPIVEFHGVPHLPDENTRQMREFRKMLGITLVDEEVEKILEKRYITMDIPGGRPGPDIERLESLSEYFNNIIMNGFKQSTEPYNGDTTERLPHHMKLEKEDSDDDGRRLLDTPTRSTPKPSNHNL